MGKKESAVDAIIQPFGFESKSTQTQSKPKQVNLGGKVVTKMVYNKQKGEWESISSVEGGSDMVVTHRIRSGKTSREKSSKVKDKEIKSVVKKKK